MAYTVITVSASQLKDDGSNVGLEYEFDDAVSALLNESITSIEIQVADHQRRKGQIYELALTYDVGAVTIANPFQLLSFTGINQEDAQDLAAAFRTTNPTYFFAEPIYRYIPQLAPANGHPHVVFQIYSADSTAVSNWNIGGGSTSEPGALGDTVAVIGSNVSSSTFANGIAYTPIAKNATEQYVEFEFVANKAGTLKIGLNYSMSVSDAGDVVLGLESSNLAAGDDPTAALDDKGNTTVTPGTGTTVKNTDLTYGSYSIADGDYVYCKLSRKNVAGDTHTGDMRILGITVEIE